MKLGHKNKHKSTLFFTKFGNDRRKIEDFLIKAYLIFLHIFYAFFKSDTCLLSKNVSGLKSL